MSFKSLLYAYILGGLTFLPGLVIGGLFYIYKYGTIPVGDPDPLKRLKKILADTEGTDAVEISDSPQILEEKDSLSEGTTLDPSEATIRRDRSASLASHRSTSNHSSAQPLTGWLTIRRSFHPFKEKRLPHGKKDAVVAGLKQGVSDIKTERAKNKERANQSSRADHGSKSDKDTVNHEEDANRTISGSNSPSVAGKYSSLFLNSYRNIVEGSSRDSSSNASSSTAHKITKKPALKEFLFCALKGNVLFMYEDSSMSNCLGVIGVEGYSVSISRGEETEDEDKDLNEDESNSSNDLSEGMSEGEVERLAASGLPLDEQARIWQSVNDRKRAKDSRRRSKIERPAPLMDGELYAKKNAIVLRPVPIQEAKRSAGPGIDSTVKASHSTGDLHEPVHEGPHSNLAAPSDTTLKSSSQEDLSVSTNALHPNALTRDMDNGTEPLSPATPLSASNVPEPSVSNVGQDEKDARAQRRRQKAIEKRGVEGRPWYIFARNNVK